MKKLILLFLMFLSSPAFASITLLSSTCKSSPDGGTLSTSSIDTTGATLIVVNHSYFGGAQLNTPTDSAGNTFTQLNINTGSNDPANVTYYINNPTTSASHTFSIVSTPSNNFPSICVAAFSGTTTSSPFDTQNGGGGSSLTTQSTGAVIPSANNELIITGLGYKVGTVSIDSGFNLISGQAVGSANGYGAAIAYLIQTSATSVNPTWTDNTSENLATSIATFKSTSSVVVSSVTTINNAVIRNATIN